MYVKIFRNDAFMRRCLGSGIELYVTCNFWFLEKIPVFISVIFLQALCKI